jgi:hypothetical protein
VTQVDVYKLAGVFVDQLWIIFSTGTEAIVLSKGEHEIQD